MVILSSRNVNQSGLSTCRTVAVNAIGLHLSLCVSMDFYCVIYIHIGGASDSLYPYAKAVSLCDPMTDSRTYV